MPAVNNMEWNEVLASRLDIERPITMKLDAMTGCEVKVPAGYRLTRAHQLLSVVGVSPDGYMIVRGEITDIKIKWASMVSSSDLDSAGSWSAANQLVNQHFDKVLAWWDKFMADKEEAE